MKVDGYLLSGRIVLDCSECGLVVVTGSGDTQEAVMLGSEHLREIHGVEVTL